MWRMNEARDKTSNSETKKRHKDGGKEEEEKVRKKSKMARYVEKTGERERVLVVLGLSPEARQPHRGKKHSNKRIIYWRRKEGGEGMKGGGNTVQRHLRAV